MTSDPSSSTPAIALPTALSDAVADFPAKAAEAASLLKALAHPGRLLLLCRLVDGERSVGALEVLTGIGQPSLSQQLAVLRGERLVATRRDGKQVLYRIDSPAALALLQTLCELFCMPASASGDASHAVAKEAPQTSQTSQTSETVHDEAAPAPRPVDAQGPELAGASAAPRTPSRRAAASRSRA